MKIGCTTPPSIVQAFTLLHWNSRFMQWCVFLIHSFVALPVTLSFFKILILYVLKFFSFNFVLKNAAALYSAGGCRKVRRQAITNKSNTDAVDV